MEILGNSKRQRNKGDKFGLSEKRIYWLYLWFEYWQLLEERMMFYASDQRPKVYFFYDMFTLYIKVAKRGGIVKYWFLKNSGCFFIIFEMRYFFAVKNFYPSKADALYT